MIRLNLLPWREQRRARALRRFQASLVAGAVAALLLVLTVDQLAQSRVREQLAVGGEYRAQVTQLDHQLQWLDEVVEQRLAIERRQAALNDLRRAEDGIPTLFAGLERTLPPGLQLTGLQLSGDQLILVGLAASAALVAQLIRRLERSSVLRDIELKRISSSPTGDAFELAARLPAHWS